MLVECGMCSSRTSISLVIPLFVPQSLMLVALLAQGLFFGIAPLYASKFSSSATALSTTNAFSGGIFLALAFMHMLPEVRL
jgi:hypothetical protein